jgi:anti-sigma factor RsiW
VNCQDIFNELTEYLDGAIDAATRAELERHLTKCKKCRYVVDTTRKTIEIFCNAEPAPLPPDVRQRLHDALAKKLGQQRRAD